MKASAKKTRNRPKSSGRRKTAAQSVRPSKKNQTFNELFKDFIGIIKDGPPDLARNHKLYASGAKKWP